MTSTLPPGGDAAHLPFYDPLSAQFKSPAGPASGGLAREVDLPTRLPAFQKIVASLQQVYLALYAAEVGIWEWNVEENTVTWSMFVDKIFGLPPQRTNCSCADLLKQIPPDDLARAKAILARALSEGASGQKFEFQCRVLRPDGERRWIEVAGSVGRSASLCLLGTVRDVTERHRRDDEARFYRALLECQNEAGLDGILVVSLNQIILYYNNRFAEIWGIPESVLASRDAQAAVDWARQAVVDPDTGVFRMDETRAASEHSKHDELILRDGRTIERYSAPVMSNDGDCLGRVWHFRDITEKRRLEARVLHAQRLDSLGSVSSGIAHELKNILTPILLNTQLTQEDLDPGHPAQVGLKEVMKGCERAKDLISQILTFSRRGESRRVPLDLHDVVTETVTMLRATIPESVTLVSRLTYGLPLVRADATQIHQIVMNLGINAWHALEAGKGVIDIALEEVELTKGAPEVLPDLPPGRYLRLSVRDDGRGMDEATLDRIFEPFFTTKPDGEGSGLGLSVVDGIVSTHQGAITVDSKPGQGALFRIYFPVVAGDPAAQPLQ
jgi:PAS domain S-box-containing protein